MLPLSAILRGLYGAWRLLRLDANGLSYFEATPRGALKSFWAMLLVLPLDLAVRAIDIAVPSGDMPAESRNLGIHLALYVIGWLAPLVIIYVLVRWYGRGDRFWLFLSALNWSQVLQGIGMLLFTGLLAGTSSLVDMGAVAEAPPANAVIGAFAALLAMGIFVVVYGYEWYVAWVSLEAGVALPIIVVLLDFVTGAVLSKAVTVLFS